MAKALEGIRVIDLTVWFQGPVCAQHLADFGAEVIKVERPVHGDQARGVQSIKALPVGAWNQYFLVINRNKKSLALDLKRPAGREVLYRLVEKSDVFLSNLGMETLAAWDLGFEKLAAINPRLVYATNTGYGHRATTAKPAFDMTVQALTGLMPRLGEPGEPPIYLGMGSGDAFGGLLSALGILVALHQRRATGRGQFVDASLYGAQLFLAAPSLQAYLAGQAQQAEQRSRRDAPNPLWNRYAARDVWLFLCADDTDESFVSLCESLEQPELAADARFASAASRAENRHALVAALDAIFAGREAGAWMERLGRAGIAASPIGTFADLARDPQVWANDYLMRTHCDAIGEEVVVRGLPITLGKTPGSIESLGPELGQDTELILTELLGYGWDELGELREKGAIP